MVDYRLAIDPGDVHVGWASRAQGITLAGEWTVVECLRKVRECIEWADREELLMELVIEEYVLYPNVNQSWSKMQTSQLIGALKLMAYESGVPVVEQGAYIKKPTRAQLKARGIKHL